MRDYQQEYENRVNWIKKLLKESHTQGIVFGNSGGKDSALVGILCKAACENTVGIMMPCQSKQNFGQDLEDGMALANQYQIETLTLDLTRVKETLSQELGKLGEVTPLASSNIAPRLRMTALYTFAQSRNSLVAGTGNRSECYVGYFTKWGDGGYDFNPIYDLTVTEVYDFLRFLKAPDSIITKAPSAGLFEGQTDEKEMGVSYQAIDRYILTGEGSEEEIQKIQKMHQRTEHKRRMPSVYFTEDTF